MLIDFLGREIVVGNRVVYTKGINSTLYKGVVTRLTPQRVIIHDVSLPDWTPLIHPNNDKWNSNIIDPLQVVKLGK